MIPFLRRDVLAIQHPRVRYHTEDRSAIGDVDGSGCSCRMILIIIGVIIAHAQLQNVGLRERAEALQRKVVVVHQIQVADC